MRQNTLIFQISVAAAFFVVGIKLDTPKKILSFKEQLYNNLFKLNNKARIVKSDAFIENQINYYLFTKDNPTSYTILNNNLTESNTAAFIEKNVKLVFLIHGWTESRDAQWYEEIKNSFLKLDERYQVIEIDWTEPANQSYLVSCNSAYLVGKIIAKYLVQISKIYSIPLNYMIGVGHSLGAHVVGFVGKHIQAITNEKINRIVGLDPAGPLFSGRPETERLSKNDANVVQVIHTDCGRSGVSEASGTVDFYPNGGINQPGCSNQFDLLDITSYLNPVMCSHHRSWEFYAEAILNVNHFVAKKCASWEHFLENKCEPQTLAIGDLESSQHGTFYLATSSKSPYGVVEKVVRRRSYYFLF